MVEKGFHVGVPWRDGVMLRVGVCTSLFLLSLTRVCLQVIAFYDSVNGSYRWVPMSETHHAAIVDKSSDASDGTSSEEDSAEDDPEEVRV